MPLSPPVIRATFAGQLAASLMLGPGGVRLGRHLLLDPRLGLALGRLQLFLVLVGHACSIRCGRGGR
jgi:hypothetical protein